MFVNLKVWDFALSWSSPVWAMLLFPPFVTGSNESGWAHVTPSLLLCRPFSIQSSCLSLLRLTAVKLDGLRLSFNCQCILHFMKSLHTGISCSCNQIGVLHWKKIPVVITVSLVQIETSLHRTRYKDNKQTAESCGMNGKISYSTTGIPLSTEGTRPGTDKTIMKTPRLSGHNAWKLFMDALCSTRSKLTLVCMVLKLLYTDLLTERHSGWSEHHPHIRCSKVQHKESC